MTERNVLFVSNDGLITDIAWRVREAGNGARYAITGSDYSQDVGDGLVEKTRDWRADLDWADLVVMDDTFGLGTDAERLRDRGIPVVGGTAYTDRLEEDRGFGQAEMADHGLNVVDAVDFDDPDDGIQYVHDNPAAYVVKPNGDAQNYNNLLYVGETSDGADVVQMLRRYRDVLPDDVSSFQLQRRKDGVEISVCAFFDGDEFLSPVNYTFEHKRLFPGDIGPMTGEMGTAMFWDPPNRLFYETLAPFEGTLAAEGYVGAFDINCIVNSDGIFPIEFTPRFGYPQIMIQEAAMETPIDEFLYGLAIGDPPDLRVHDGFQVGFRVCVPPFPSDDVKWFDEHSRDLEIQFRGDGVPEGIHPEDMKYTDGEYRVASETGEVLVVTGRGKSMRTARRQAYNRAENVVLPNKFYRRDVGEKWEWEAEQLIRWGYLR